MTEEKPVDGVTRSWSDDEGWGVLDSAATPGGCWVHFSAVDMEPPVRLEVGQRVRATVEAVTDQDGFRWRAVHVRPEGTRPDSRRPVTDAPGAYRSRLDLTFDDPG